MQFEITAFRFHTVCLHFEKVLVKSAASASSIRDRRLRRYGIPLFFPIIQKQYPDDIWLSCISANRLGKQLFTVAIVFENQPVQRKNYAGIINGIQLWIQERSHF